MRARDHDLCVAEARIDAADRPRAHELEVARGSRLLVGVGQPVDGCGLHAVEHATGPARRDFE